MHDHAHDVEVKKVDRISPTQVRLTIAFDGKTLIDHEKKMAQQYTRQASLPGFRPGKAPVKMVLDRYRDKIRQDVVSHLLEAGLSEALEKTKLMPVSRPRIDIGKINFDGTDPLEFQAEFEVEPEVQVKAYKGVPLNQPETAVTDDEVDQTIESLRDRVGVLEPCEETRPQAGHFGVIEVGFFLVDEPSRVEAPSTFTVELGRGKLIPEIDQALMEMSTGESRKVEGVFPEDYHEKTLSGKKAVFDCKLIELKKRTLPEVNDAFAETIRPGMTLLALRADIRKNIEDSKAQQARRGQRQQILDYLVKQNHFEVPRAMVERQTRKLLDSMAQDLKSRGKALPTLKDDEMKAVWDSAEEIVRGGLLLKRIAEQENISLKEEKFKERVASVAEQIQQTPEQAEKFLQGQGVLDRLRDEVLTDQIFDFLIENAKSA